VADHAVKRSLAFFLVVLLAAFALPAHHWGATAVALAQQQEEPGSPRGNAAVTFLQINDVYSTVPVDGFGGLARVATLKQQLKAQGRTPFIVLAGDFLSPSVASSVFKGEQMIAALNAAGLDLATLGNHEFDFGDDLLIERMKQARWQWVVSNVIDRRTGKPIGGASPYVMRTFGSLKVGFIGLCLTTTEINREKLTHTQLLDPMLTAAKYIPLLRAQGAQMIVAVTHLTFADDRRLTQRFPEIDLIIGGHEHYPITASEGRALVSKAGSDARWVARIDVVKRTTTTAGTAGSGPVERFFELIPITSAIPDEPDTAKIVNEFETKLGIELDVVVGDSTVALDGQSVRIRAEEAPIGNFFADAMREHVGADVGIVNAGSIRGDRSYPAGPLTRRTILAMHPFGNVLCKVEVTGARLLAALESGLSKLPASAGQFPQVSGVTLTVDMAARGEGRLKDVKVNGVPLDPARRYTVAIPDYLLTGGDQYSAFVGQRVLIGPESGDLLVTALERYVAQHKPIAPRTDGRITISR